MLLSNNPGLTRVASCLYEVSNVYNLKSYNGDLTRMRTSMPKSDELLFTQVAEWPESRQNFQMLRHSNGKILQQRSRFYALWIKRSMAISALRVASNWFIKFDGEEKLGVQLDYDYIQKRWKMGVMLRAEQRVEKLIAKRAREAKREKHRSASSKNVWRRLGVALGCVQKLKIKTDRRASIVPKLTSRQSRKPSQRNGKPAKPAKPKAATNQSKAKPRVPKR